MFHNAGVRLDRVRGGRQKYKRRPEVENATYQSAPLPLTKESEKGGIYILVLSLVFLFYNRQHFENEMKSVSIYTKTLDATLV